MTPVTVLPSFRCNVSARSATASTRKADAARSKRFMIFSMANEVGRGKECTANRIVSSICGCEAMHNPKDFKERTTKSESVNGVA